MSTAQTAARTRKPRVKSVPVMETVICHICGAIKPKEETTEFDSKYLCSDCIDHETFLCERCNERVWNDENAGDYDIKLCQDCYDSYYSRCDDCDRVIRLESAYYLGEDDEEDNPPYCYHCYSKPRDSEPIHNYSYKPQPIFYGDDNSNRYFGVELEIDYGGRDNDNAYHILQVANRNTEAIYIKQDGSLEDGFEIVTHPMTLDYHMNDMDWKKLTQKALRLGYKSHKTDTCGLHIHVNRTTFGDDYSHQELCISKVLFILERFWEEFLRFSRRNKEQIQHWATRYGYRSQPIEILNTAKSSNYNRHTCVNLTNSNTIEFRIFKGTLKVNTIIATLQLVNHICNTADLLSTDDITELNWCEFMERISKNKYPELITYLKERRLYVNEPIETEEDE